MWGRARSRPEGADETLRRALLGVLDNDLEGAEALLRDVATRDSSATLHLALARLYRRRGEIGRAIQLHQNLLLRSDLDREERVLAELGLGDDFRAAGLLKRASAAYDAALEKHPKDPRALRALLAVLDERGESGRALAIARRLHGRRGAGRGDLAGRFFSLAKQCWRDGDEAAARAALKGVWRSQRDHAGAFVLSGEIEASRGRARRAMAAWRKALALDPGSAPDLYTRIEALYRSLDRPAETQRFLRAEISRLGEAADAPRFALARHLAESGEHREALGELDGMDEGSRFAEAVREMRARFALEHGDDAARTRALEALLKAAARDPGITEVDL